MKLVAENPEEDKLLDAYISMIQEKGYPCCYKETFEESALKEAFSFGAHFNKDIRDLHMKDWSPSQRMWFYLACEDFLQSKECKELKDAFVHFVGVYDEIFKEETAAINAAKQDYGLYLSLEKAVNAVHVDTYRKLKQFLEHSVKKGADSDIKTVSLYYDQDLSYNVIELNSIKVPVFYKDKKLCSNAIIYGWSDMDFAYSHEFFKYDLLDQKGAKEDSHIQIESPMTIEKQTEPTKEAAVVR